MCKEMIYWIRTNRQGGNLHHNDQEGMFDTESINWQDDIDVEIVIINDNWLSPWWSGRFMKIAKRVLEVCATSKTARNWHLWSLWLSWWQKMEQWNTRACWSEWSEDVGVEVETFYALAFWCHQWRQQEINWQASAGNKTREITDGRYGILTEEQATQ